MSDHNEAAEFTKNTGIPLDTEVIEQVPVRKISIDEIDEKTGSAKYSVKTVLEHQKVRYMHVPKVKHRCKSGEHNFRVLDPKKGIFGCTLCPYAVRILPSNYMFKDGKLIHRRTLRVV